MKEFPEDYELMSFFEMEPELLDKDVIWNYNTLIFKIERNNEKIMIYILPAYGDFEIFWEQDHELRMHWKMFNINSIKIEKKDDKEYMRIISKDENIEECLFFMKPCIKLIGGMKIVH